MTIAHIFNSVVVLVVGVRFVDGIVGEMDEEIWQIFCLWKFIGFSGKTN